jgi:hypothetical protein
MYALEHAMQSPRVRWNHDQVYVVRHQAVGDDIDGKLPGMLVKQIQVRQMVAATEEHALAVIAPLRDVVGHAGKDNARASRHARTLFRFQLH